MNARTHDALDLAREAWSEFWPLVLTIGIAVLGALGGAYLIMDWTW